MLILTDSYNKYIFVIAGETNSVNNDDDIFGRLYIVVNFLW